ncbi:MAG: putative phosphomannomutase [Pseudonocardiales bacterium]|nr:putative phosphomannomutase [Pseudonocardiales bacterium]
MAPTPDLEETVRAWIADDVDPHAGVELQALLDAGSTAELEDRFAGPLTFGTAGLRGPLRAGPNGMNRAVVRRAAAGLASWLHSHGAGPGSVVVVGYDARHGSHDFAHDSAAIFAAAGFDAQVLNSALPTPVLAFAVKRLGAIAGVMVTASHNPPEDNGYKVYGRDGAQIVSPTDVEIEAAIKAVGPTRQILLAEDYTVLDDVVVSEYVDAIAALVGPPATPLKIVHTALHGVGTKVFQRVLARAGYDPALEVARQSAPDPEFPTVSFPNPEEPGAMDLALALARTEPADLVIANDPDADRCACAVDFPSSGWRMLRGDETGALLANALLRKGIRGRYATTIVSSTLLSAMAANFEVDYTETLTGFKWISRAGPDLVFGYEEALGYAVAPELVRDKDGISAGLMLAELAAELKAAGSSIPERLQEIYQQYGWHLTDQISIRVEDGSIISDTMARLRADPPKTLLGAETNVTDLLPGADVLTFRWPGGRVVVRPSGTEPKLKAYLEVVVAADDAGGGRKAHQLLRDLRAEVSGLIGA